MLRPGMGPSCQLKSLLASEEDTNQSNNDRFNKLNMSEDRKINLFFLKDTLLSKEAAMHDKMEALSQIRKNATLPAFKFAIESVM